MQVDVSNPNSLGNAYADLLTGTLNSYNESSFNRINDIAYSTYEGFAQDCSRHVTGLRADGHPNPDFVPAARDVEGHQSIKADARKEQRKHGERAAQCRSRKARVPRCAT